MARQVAMAMDKPGWIYREFGVYQVVCVEWGELAAAKQEDVIAVVLPDGREFVQASSVPALTREEYTAGRDFD